MTINVLWVIFISPSCLAGDLLVDHMWTKRKTVLWKSGQLWLLSIIRYFLFTALPSSWPVGASYVNVKKNLVCELGTSMTIISHFHFSVLPTRWSVGSYVNVKKNLVCKTRDNYDYYCISITISITIISTIISINIRHFLFTALPTRWPDGESYVNHWIECKEKSCL